MQVSEILHTLPATLEWMVLFNLSAISKMADDATIRDMYHLPKEINLESYSHVVLTNQGRFLAPHDESKLIEPFSGNSWSREQIKTSLYKRFASHLALFSVDEANPETFWIVQSGVISLFAVPIVDGVAEGTRHYLFRSCP
ncbi:MAG: hypothetical protein PUP92_11700 [Rhizonema sp. PD38]|nr:hypothetical protein [Rhizonema sp. PD38]